MSRKRGVPNLCGTARRDEFVTGDIKCAASIIAFGVQPTAAVQVRGRWIHFCFPPTAATVAARHLAGELMVNSRDLFYHYDELWTMITEWDSLPALTDNPEA